MLKNSSKILFFLILMAGTLISISSSSWLSAWMGLEINLLAFIPLMTATNNLMSSEASLKYFLTQALASSVLLFSIIVMMIKSAMAYQISTFTHDVANTMILSSLMLKAGAAPFHFWFPSVMEGLSWTNSLILMTWQKMAPLMLMSYLINSSLTYLSIMLSITLGSLGGLNQTSVRKMMAFSSISHLGWMLAAMISSETLWLTYFVIYSFLSLNMIFLFNTFNLLHINQAFTMFSHSKPLKFCMFLNLLSLGGLPPFLGFMPKWLVIQTLTFNNQLFLLTYMVTFTLVTLYFYLRLSYSALMLNYNETAWNICPFSSPSFLYTYLMTSFISSCSLFSVAMLFTML